MPTHRRRRQPSQISDEALFSQYGKFCKYMAWQFAKRSLGEGMDRDDKSLQLYREDVEDLASVATYHLLRIPQHYRDQPAYVKRVIVTKIITAWHKRMKYGRKEYQPAPVTEDRTDWFDSLPGRDGLAESTQIGLDSARVIALIDRLAPEQQLVLELHFGLNGAKPCGSRKIAIKLARTRWWVDARLQAGLAELRKAAGAPAKAQSFGV